MTKSLRMDLKQEGFIKKEEPIQPLSIVKAEPIDEPKFKVKDAVYESDDE